MKFLKYLLLTFLVLVAIIAAWGFWYTTDEKLNPEATAFFTPLPPFDPERNFYVAWNGLYAPAGTQDPYAYGLKLYNGDVEWDDNTALRYQESDKSFDCWTKQATAPPPQEQPDKPCAAAKDIQENYSQNREFIERYKTLYAYDNFTKKSEPGYARGQDLIEIHKLLAAYWPMLAQTGRGAQALQEWIDDTAFLQEYFTYPHDIVEHAIWVIMYGSNINALPMILEKDPTLLENAEWLEKLETVLKKDMATPEIWTNVMRGERNFIIEGLSQATEEKFSELTNLPKEKVIKMKRGMDIILKPNYLENSLYKWAQSLIWLAERPPGNFEENKKIVSDKFIQNDLEFNPLMILFDKNFIANMILKGALYGQELVLNAHAHNAKSRALILYIRAKAQNIPPEGMPEFLQKADPSLHDPFTEQPFRWDAQAKSLYFSKQEGSRDDLYYAE